MATEGSDDLWVPASFARETAAKRREIVGEQIAGNMADTEALVKAMTANPTFPHKFVELFRQLGWYKGITEPQKATSLTLQILKRAGTAHIVRTITGTRVNQVKRFTYRSQDINKPGYVIRKVDRDERPTAGDRKRMDEIGDFVDNCGRRRKRPLDNTWGVWAADYLYRGMGFPAAMGAWLQDSLVCDAAPLWIVAGRNAERYPVEFFSPLDGALIRRTIPDLPAFRPDAAREHTESMMVGELEPYKAQFRSGKIIEYVMLRPGQHIDNEEQVLAEFTHDELAYLVRNPRTDWWTQGYGFSELESMLGLLTGVLNAIAFNESTFTHSNIPPAIVLGSGNFGDDVMLDFMTTMVANVGGPNKWHKIPFLFGDDGAKLDVVPLRQTQRDDMMWREYLIFVINLLCAGYHIAAEEINFQAFLTRGGVMTQDAGAERVAYAQETGLHELIRQVFGTLNMAIVRRFYADPETGLGPYEIAPTGVEKLDEATEQEKRIGRIHGGLSTPNQELTEMDKPPFRDPVDPELWERIRLAALRTAPRLEFDPVRLDEVIVEIYRNHDGKLRRWPDMPVAFEMTSARQQEMQEEKDEEAAEAAEEAGGEFGEQGFPGDEEAGGPTMAQEQSLPPELVQQMRGRQQGTQGTARTSKTPEPTKRGFGARAKNFMKSLNPLRWLAAIRAAREGNDDDQDEIETFDIYIGD